MFLGGPLGSGPLESTWGMFALTGNPAYYLLYKSILDDDLSEEEKQRR